MITFTNFGHVNHKEVLLFQLKNSSGAMVELTNYGAAIVSVKVPGTDGEMAHVVAGFNNLQAYLDDKCYIGSTIGRFANRIANSTFSLEGKQYLLETNDNANSNHGGSSGYNYQVFDYRMEHERVLFTLNSPDGDGGYQGNLELTVCYEWTAENQLKINYLATTDQLTIANFTNHAYFNLSGEGDDITGHRLSIYADKVLETDNEYIPNGEIIAAGKKALSGDKLGDKISINDGMGFNDYYILGNVSKNIKLAAVLDHEASGRRLNVFTTYPGLMFYTGDYLNSTAPGHLSKPYKPFDGLCLECQFYPDAPNHSGFPSTALKPGEQYKEEIIYEFTLIHEPTINL
ncbi:galactose mutarotase [Mucilaginibacter sp. BJC16-A38]|uniref:aldose epimerase family protein n=1 Tax=Mucilaginibacter phenanthrenivorans TaxID=1234842 RepID=UPI0021577C1E|nr:aldose epimerase family protein [Mucilaginibacter phenanthrenivorans]MCR8560005.1 galactose mutarotase [Mucilaginibacter phenanthrenivorans]